MSKIILGFTLLLAFHPQTTFSNAQSCLVPNCAQCLSDNPNYCLKCKYSVFAPYILQNGACRECAEIYPHCVSCDSTQCQSCNSGYTLDPAQGNKVCVQCSKAMPHCASCYTDRCSSCESGFTLDFSQKNCCLSNCEGCQKTSDCPVCNQGYTYTNGACQSGTCPQANCAQCGKDGCVTCKANHVFFNQTCQPGDCSTYYPSCEKCDKEKCTQCTSGKVMRDGKCTCYLSLTTLPNCDVCDTFDAKCSQCDQGFILKYEACYDAANLPWTVILKDILFNIKTFFVSLFGILAGLACSCHSKRKTVQGDRYYIGSIGGVPSYSNEYYVHPNGAKERKYEMKMY